MCTGIHMICLTSVSRLTWGVHFVSWTLPSGCTTCNQSVTNVACICRNNSYSIYIVSRHDRLWNNIKPMQSHFNTQPLARWRHSRITKWPVSKWLSWLYNSSGIIVVCWLWNLPRPRGQRNEGFTSQYCHGGHVCSGCAASFGENSWIRRIGEVTVTPWYPLIRGSRENTRRYKDKNTQWTSFCLRAVYCGNLIRQASQTNDRKQTDYSSCNTAGCKECEEACADTLIFINIIWKIWRLDSFAQ